MSGKLSRWLNRSANADNGANLDHPNVIGNTDQSESRIPEVGIPTPTGSNEKQSKIDRWLARSKQDDAGSEGHAISDDHRTNPVPACCSLFQLMDAAELLQVHKALLATMEQKQLLSTNAGGLDDMSAVLVELEALAVEADKRRAACEAVAAAREAEERQRR
eukprot:CAMPEP_0113663410 /NCGR_PEP_ID=MMETSP0038_2-20120614/1126_1 /TAXON_ID=2898 /ORGANISM="Cryptomonas paramecium" /LENGTH=161 /DNA_ID=CAMNT_0000578433 /DNA_START=6 /DNA_END=487 /DNA_ORIENTATION=- /assembly_acc=CAM_ASM_000170